MTTSAASPISALSPTQAEVALSIASGASVSEAARRAGIHRSTVYEWMRSEPGFHSTIQEARQEHLDLLRGELRSISTMALNRLGDLLNDPETPPSVTLRAALAVLGRPLIPDQAWLLPTTADTSTTNRPDAPPACASRSDEDDFARDLAEFEADFAALRGEEAPLQAAETDTIRQNPTQIPTSPRISCTDRPPQVPRNAPCPCGSGKKYKRCCGAAEPPVLYSGGSPNSSLA